VYAHDAAVPVSSAAAAAAHGQVGTRTAVRVSGATLTVTDDGTGFATKTAVRGLGLTSMRERAASVGGTLAVQSTPGQGTVIRLEVPGVRSS
jgi:signal transduction histidine kinase